MVCAKPLVSNRIRVLMAELYIFEKGMPMVIFEKIKRSFYLVHSDFSAPAIECVHVNNNFRRVTWQHFCKLDDIIVKRNALTTGLKLADQLMSPNL